MNKLVRTITGIIIALTVLYVLWYFFHIVVYLLIAIVLSIIGQPLVDMIDRLKIGKVRIPHAISALITMVIMISLISFLVILFVPLITRQAEVISDIDVKYIAEVLRKPMMDFELFLLKYGVIPEDQTIESVLTEWVESVLSFATFSNIFKSLLSITGTFFIGVFAVLFFTFFFLKDKEQFRQSIILLLPEKYENETVHVLSTTRYLLTRYFIGLCIELFSMVTLLSIGLSFFGVENALLIGFLGGIMNIIPYLGPVIGAMIGVILGVTGSLGLGLYMEVFPIVLKIISVFVVANLIDNIVLQPAIYSSSVKAHPIEIFLVILIAGSLAGITGMVLAIPSYTVLRVIAKEFFGRFRLIRKLTENI